MNVSSCPECEADLTPDLPSPDSVTEKVIDAILEVG